MNKNNLLRPTWVEIDLAALKHNLKQVKRLVGKNSKVLCVVKADAYGHGMIEVSKKLVSCGVDYLGVAGIDEAIKLRKASIKTPILVLENIPERHAGLLVDYNLTQGICTMGLVEKINRYAKRKNKIARVHVKIDTGMGRLGFWHKDALKFIKYINKLSNIKIEGIYTHFPVSDVDKNFTNYQIGCFESLINGLKDNSINIPLSHAANSIGVIDYKKSHLNLVRPGLMLYGIYPRERLRPKVKLKPVMAFKTRIMYLKRIPRGHSVSYGRTFIASKPTLIATLPVGYSDGYFRSLSNKAGVIVKGKRYKVAGRVCMDQTMIDLGNLKQIKIGDIVVLVGKQSGQEITLEELAKKAHTISYELACSIGNSCAYRFYKRN